MGKSRSKEIYEFEDFRLDAAHLLLYRNGREISLAPKVVETLLALVERCGEVLSKDELMEIVWADSIVEDGNLSQNLYLLRKALPVTASGRPLIETLHRRGFRFNGDVSRIEVKPAENSPTDKTRFAVPKASTDAHGFSAERSGGIPRATDRKTGGRDEQENEDSQSKTQEIAAEKSSGKIQVTGNSPLVGREKEILQIKSLLSRNDVRLVTLAGVGGAGKTRLAQAIAQEMSIDFLDGAVFVELATITNSELVVSIVAQSLGLKEASDKPILENLKDYLRDKQMLIVADNFEQVIDAASNIAELLAAAAKLKVLITSRMLLNLSAEREFIVPPLAVPDETANISLDELSDYEAIRLFVERARNAKSNFVLTDDNAPIIAEICQRLDGLPLAIELAAARIKIISPPAILAKLANRLKLLTGGAGDLPARQQTMRGAIEWSYDLLTEDEKNLFRRLAVFAGGFTFEAAEELVGGQQSAIIENPSENTNADRLAVGNDKSTTGRLPLAVDVLDVITSLIDKSLLVFNEQANDERRFRMLETVREYALECLEENSEAQALRRSHALYFLLLGEEAEPHLNTAQAGKWLTRLEVEHNNLRGAIRWLFENEPAMAARLAASIRIYLINHSYLTEGREWLTTALEQSAELPEAVRFKLFNGLGYLAVYQGDYAAARKFFEADLAEARTSGDEKRIAESLRGLGTVAYSQGDVVAARQFLEEGLAINRKLDYKFGIAASLNGLGSFALDEGDSKTAQALFEESLTNFRLLGNENGICYCLLNLGVVAYFSGDYEAAQKYYSETLRTAQKLGYKDRVSLCLDGFAALAVKRGEWELAAKLAGSAEYLREQIGYESEPIDRQRRNAYLAELETNMDEAAFSELYALGREFKLAEVMRFCLEESGGEHL